MSLYSAWEGADRTQPEHVSEHIPESAVPVCSGRSRWVVGLVIIVSLGGLISVLILTVMILSGSRSPRNNAVTFGLNRCGGAVCFRGLIPGQTTWKAALAAFNGRAVTIFDPPEGMIALFPSEDETSLGRILIRFTRDDPGSFRAGDVVLIYGPPCGVAYLEPARPLALLYSFGYFTFHHTTSRLNPFAVVQDVVFIDPAVTQRIPLPCAELPSHPERVVLSRPWRGL